MLVTKVSCPKCKTVLRPAKPIAVGKKVKCPKCQTDFAAQESDAAKADAAKAAATTIVDPKGKATPAAASKKAEKPAAKKAAPAKKPDDDDDEGGTYGIVAADRPKTQEDLDREAEERDDDDEEDSGKVNFVPDQSIKDLRGPAQLAINRPSNFLIANGVIGFFGWAILFIIMIIPAVFPAINEEVDPNAVNMSQKEKKKEESKLSLYKFIGLDLRVLSKPENWYWLVLALTPVVLGIVYACFQAYGAVKMQNIESRGWGIAASILCMFPYSTLGFVTVIGMFIHLFVLGFTDDPVYATSMVFVWAGLEAVSCLGIGIYALLTCMRQDVIDGFEYVPDL